MTTPITPAEAREILSRFNASHWNNKGEEKARYSIPADPSRDDDIRLAAFIDQAEAMLPVVEAAVRYRTLFRRVRSRELVIAEGSSVALELVSAGQAFNAAVDRYISRGSHYLDTMRETEGE